MHSVKCNSLYRWAGASFAVAIAVLASLPAQAQDAYPSRPVTLTVPFPPGGAGDRLARTVGTRLAEKWGQPVLIDNKSGGGTLIGSEAVARAAPDGYTLLMNISSLVQAPHLNKNVTFDPVKSLAPITEAATLPLILVSNSQEPSNTLAELVERIRANPGKYSYGTYGAGSAAHLYTHILSQQLDLDMVHVPYRGSAQTVNDLLGGQIPLAVIAGVAATPHLKTGKMKAFAITGPERAPTLEGVPTFKELGYTGMDERGWFGFFAPAGTAQAILEKISTDINEILKEPQVAEQLAPSGFVLLGSSPDQFKKVVERDNDKWARVIKESGIQAEQ